MAATIRKPSVQTVSAGETALPSRRLEIIKDNELIYTAFFADFGPLHLGHTYRFCHKLDGLLREHGPRGRPVTFFCSSHPHRQANAAVLLMAFLIFVKKLSVEDAYGPFIGMDPPFCTFRDAAFGINSFPITVLDCARAFHRAQINGHFEYASFDVEAFSRLAKYENGDISWIIPGKFIAFSGPLSTRRDLGNGLFSLLPQEYVPIFKRLGVSCVIRFNNKCYDRKVFTKAGIRHVDLFYEDGGNPTESILQSFLQICEQERGAIAVHCKAGLGRTGTNIAAYMIKHYGYTTKESIAWCRVCRPGSVVGPQQQYLAHIEPRVKEEGERYRRDNAKIRQPTVARTQTENHLSIQQAPPIGKPPTSPAQSPTLWTGSSTVKVQLPTAPVENLEARRPSTGEARPTSHRSHAYHQNGSQTLSRRNSNADESRQSVSSIHPGEVVSVRKQTDQTRQSQDAMRPSTGASGSKSGSANKMRSSLNESPYSRSNGSTSPKLLHRR